MNFDALETRDVAVEPARAVLLIVDVQNFSARRSGGEFRGLSTEETEARYGWFFRKIETEAVPNMQRLIAVCRAAGVEVMYTVIESLTRDGRDRSLDYRITGFHVPRGSWDAQVLDEVSHPRTRSFYPRRRRTCSSRPISTTCSATWPSGN